MGYEITQTMELSTSGMLMTTAKMLHPGTLVDVDITLPTREGPIPLKGKVVSCRKSEHIQTHRTALRFVHPDPDAVNAIKKTVALLWKEKERGASPVTRKIVERARRSARSIMLRYRPIITKNETQALNQTVNISVSGILFRTERAYRVNQLMELHLNLPMMSDGTAIRGRVARCHRLKGKEFETAVAFTHIEKPVRKAILQMIRV